MAAIVSVLDVAKEGRVSVLPLNITETHQPLDNVMPATLVEATIFQNLDSSWSPKTSQPAAQPPSALLAASTFLSDVTSLLKTHQCLCLRVSPQAPSSFTPPLRASLVAQW